MPKIIHLHTVKWFNVLLCISKNSIKDQSFVYIQLSEMKTVSFLFVFFYCRPSSSSCVQILRAIGASMHSTDPSYDNRTIVSTLKMQIRTVQRLRAQLNASDAPWEVVGQKDIVRKTRTKEFIEKVQANIDETPQRPIRQIARNLDVSHPTVNACVKEDLKCRSYRSQRSQIMTEKKKNLRLIKSVRPLSSPDLNPLDYFVWSYVENITNMTSHNTKASLITAIRQVFAKLPPALVEKACS